jgi:predicted XRE-type DNA-binding protein
MKRKTNPIADNAVGHITPVGGNVVRVVIAKKLAIKKQLMDSLADWMVQEKLTQAKAASLLGVSRPRVSDVIRHKNSNFTVDALIDMVVRTGQPLQITL